MEFYEELDLCFRACFTLVIVTTREEERALEGIHLACDLSRRTRLIWDLADGFDSIETAGGAQLKGNDPLTALETVGALGDGYVVVLRDFHDCWTNAKVKRKLRNVTQKLVFTQTSIVVVTPQTSVPEELRDVSVVIDLAPPGELEIRGVLSELSGASGVRNDLTPLGQEKMAQAALGLSKSEARRAFSRAVVEHGSFNERHIREVAQEKRRILQESEALEFELVDESATPLGGLGVLKDFIRIRARGFTSEAREYGLDSPRGVLLIGLPGTGKSLTARTVAMMWSLPLLRLDTGALYHSLVGESELRARRALAVVDSVSPCVLWIDEIEKAFSVGGFDGGTSMRVLGTLLTWMQEKGSSSFVVATANAVDALPPELMRRGRFDEIFFLDLPTVEERREIAEIHLSKRGRLALEFDVEAIASATVGFVGAEIEQAIVDAMWVGFDQGREFTTADIVASAARQIPLSRSHSEAVALLRRWLDEGRARSASSAVSGNTGRLLTVVPTRDRNDKPPG